MPITDTALLLERAEEVRGAYVASLEAFDAAETALRSRVSNAEWTKASDLHDAAQQALSDAEDALAAVALGLPKRYPDDDDVYFVCVKAPEDETKQSVERR